MKINTPASLSVKNSNVGMHLLASAFDWLLITLLLPLVLLFVFGQTWLLDQVSYSNTSLYVVVFAVPAVYFLSFWSLWGATPGKLLLLPWLER
ncbi:MAG: hypothetical protein BWK73_51325 [Thiothrix lacustris]|uniref:RDD domain-containing protein n=1 Tax=Thiothrix lacustris TaxID=525917 RepID=A0A1Y1Q880_9GAMM|nr:MAG: hypothetical protein BWK73_51325 [Thiothrix lacustris]